MADASAARSYIQQAQELIANRDFDKANAKLELADVEMEDLSGDEKAAVAQLIQEAQASIASSKMSEHRPRYLRMIDNLMREAESDIGNLVTWPGREREITELFADETANAAIPAELADAQPKFNTFKKLHARKATAEILSGVEVNVAQAEEEWNETKALFEDADSSSYSRDRGVERVTSSIESARRRLAPLPTDNDGVKSIVARLDAISSEIAVVALSGKAQEIADRLKRNFELYENEFEGWMDETGDGPSWDNYRRNNTDRMAAFGAPATLAYVNRNGEVLDGLERDDEYKAVAAASQVKAIVDSTRANVDGGKAMLLARAQALVATALNAKVEDEYEFERLERDIGRALGDDSKEGNALRAKVTAKMKGEEVLAAEEKAANSIDIEALSAKANEVWPTLYEGLTWGDEIDLAAVGSNIGFLSDNLIGYRFSPGDFYFATTIAGTPVAGKIDKSLLAGIKATEGAIGRALGDDDNDGKWDIVATVTDKKAKLSARRQGEASGTIGGVNVELTSEYHEPVDAVVIEILAAKCGPFAGAKGKGYLKHDGSIGN
ncbi:MAG: hypothetical protein ABJC26_00270 [Gemmatimonadaceae bacterium]